MPNTQAEAETESAIRLQRAMTTPIAHELPVQYAQPEPFTQEAAFDWVERLRTPALIFLGALVLALCLLASAGLLHFGK